MLSHFISWDGLLYKGPGRVRFQGEAEVLFDSRMSCTWHVVVSPYFRHLCLVLDGFRLFASGCRCFWGVCRWLLKFFEMVLGGFRSFHVLVLTNYDSVYCSSQKRPLKIEVMSFSLALTTILHFSKNLRHHVPKVNTSWLTKTFVVMLLKWRSSICSLQCQAEATVRW